jgi:hypothetical protein
MWMKKSFLLLGRYDSNSDSAIVRPATKKVKLCLASSVATPPRDNHRSMPMVQYINVELYEDGKFTAGN